MLYYIKINNYNFFFKSDFQCVAGADEETVELNAAEFNPTLNYTLIYYMIFFVLFCYVFVFEHLRFLCFHWPQLPI